MKFNNKISLAIAIFLSSNNYEFIECQILNQSHNKQHHYKLAQMK